MSLTSSTSLSWKDVILTVLPTGELAAPLLTQVLGALQEGVINEHFGAPAALGVLVQALVDEVLEIWGPLRRDPWRLILHDIKQDACVVLRDVGRLALGQLDAEDA